MPGLSATGVRPDRTPVPNKLRFYYQMDEKQNQKDGIHGPTCANCGGIKFLHIDDLSEDQKIVAKRLTEVWELRGAEIVFCSRCLYPTLLPADKA